MDSASPSQVRPQRRRKRWVSMLVPLVAAVLFSAAAYAAPTATAAGHPGSANIS
jgi:hypothetical protein